MVTRPKVELYNDSCAYWIVIKLPLAKYLENKMLIRPSIIHLLRTSEDVHRLSR